MDSFMRLSKVESDEQADVARQALNRYVLAMSYDADVPCADDAGGSELLDQVSRR